MSKKNQPKGEVVGIYTREDRRSENRELAFKFLFRELRSLNLSEQSQAKVDALLERWSVEEVEIGTSLSVGVDFPKDLTRNQWFYEEGQAVPRNVKGKK